MLMQEMRELEESVIANGRVESHEMELLRQGLYQDGKIDRNEADFLVVLHKRVKYRTPAFEKFFYKAIKDYILASGRIRTSEVAWLRQMLFQDGRIEDAERKFLHELKGEARELSREFEELYEAVTKLPPERHTSG